MSKPGGILPLPPEREPSQFAAARTRWSARRLTDPLWRGNALRTGTVGAPFSEVARWFWWYRQASGKRRLLRALGWLWLGLMGVTPLRTCAASGPVAKPAPEWEALFRRESGWIGADGDYSIPLGGDRILWLFSDTFVGKVKDGKRRDARMIHNSIALQRGTNAPEFYYGTNADGKATAFIHPQQGSGQDYFWLSHGTRTDRGLYFFLVRVVTVRPDTPFGFKVVDGWLAHVENPDASPAQWRITQTEVPFTKVSTNGALIFGGAVLRDGDYAYVFGGDSRAEAKQSRQANGLVLARVRADQFGDFGQWRFWADGEWQKDGTKVTPLFPHVGSEYSVSWLPGRKAYAAVYSEGIWGRVVVRLALALTGPWGKPIEVYHCPEMAWQTKAFCYAAKAHPELATGPDELLITYAANAWDFWDLFKDARLYWPRFVRVNLDGINQ